jgi:hypothetical protein
MATSPPQQLGVIARTQKTPQRTVNNAQRAERDGIVPANVSTRAVERFLAL